jgi:hypothetical protein
MPPLDYFDDAALNEKLARYVSRTQLPWKKMPGVDPAILSDQAVHTSLAELIKKYGLQHGPTPFETTLFDKALDHANAAAGDASLLTGRVAMAYGAPGAGLTLRLQARGFGGDKQFLGDPLQADENGFFKFSAVPKPGVSYEIIAVGKDGEEIVLGAPFAHSAEAPTEIALVAPAELKPPASEFERLNASISAIRGAALDLAMAKEDTARPGSGDLGMLAADTGWDIRLMALAAGAKQNAATSKLPFKASYALARMGLPTDPASLAFASAATIRTGLEQGRAAGIADIDDDEIANILERHQQLAREQLDQLHLSPTGDSVGDFIAMAATSAQDAERFREALFAYISRGDGDKTLWQLAAEKQVGAASIERLRWEAPLARLTGVNAALMAPLIDSLDPGQALSQLVTTQGLTTQQAWTERLRAIAGGQQDALERLLPPTRAEDASVDTRLEAYAAMLAAQVRHTFPTEVLLHRIGAMDPGKLGLSAPERQTMLTALTADPQMRIGARGISGIAATLAPKPRAVVERLHRLYQLTPDDATFDLVWDEPAFASAFDIAGIARTDWLDYFRRHMPGRFPALQKRLESVHDKSVQISETLQNFYSSVSSTIARPATGVLRDAAPGGAATASLQQRFPTLAAMAGELPACEHCQSVLSPSAYFVDLLRLLDRPDGEWSIFKSRYKADHQAEYPHPKPFEVLDARRPDLAELALTCANTHTALPYIDIVNELLEDIVSPLARPAGAVGDDETFSTEELVAEPRRTRPAAYEKLTTAFYPAALPLDLPWEQARAAAPLLGVQPGELVELLHADQPSLAAAERLGLSPAEARLYLDPAQAADWFRWYGLDSGDPAPLRQASALAQRLALTPVQLIAVIRTQFVNPQLQSLVVLQKLGLSLSDVVRDHFSKPPFSPAERSEFDARLHAMDQRHAASGFDSRATLDRLWIDGRLADALVLAETVPGGAFDTLELRCCDGRAPAKGTWLRLMQFVRLMRLFGWSVEQADSMLCALHPGGAALRDGADAVARMEALLVQLDRMRQLQTLLKSSDDDFFLPAMWSDLPVTGPAPLYAQLFLRDAARAPFDDPAGAYLSEHALLHDHLPATAAGLGMDEASVRVIFPATDTALTVATVSTLYRHARLADALGLSLAGLLEWIDVLDIDPCAAAGTTPAGALLASKQSLRFVRTLTRLRERQLTASRLAGWIRASFVPPPHGRAPHLLQVLQAEFGGVTYPAEAMARRIVLLLGADDAGWLALARALIDPIRADLAQPIDWKAPPPFASEAPILRLAAAIDAVKALSLDAQQMETALQARGVFGADPAGSLLDGYAGGQDTPAAWIDLLEWADPGSPAGAQAPAGLALVRAAAGAIGQDAARALDAVAPILAELAGCSHAEVRAAVATLWPGEGDMAHRLTSWRGLDRLARWLLLASRCNQSPVTLARWARLSDGASAFAERSALAAELRNAARSRFGARAWLASVRPGADRLRQRRRDALLAWVIRTQGLGSDDAVYEKYLVDTRMEPVVLTSRLRLAIAAVQLFVQRCLLNLEKDQVSPAAIRAGEWEWMKRYRVWEANRKIFLYPENWLDPEFRDDRSHLFRRLERRLLQTEINNDEAEDAFFEYARGLETIANLDIVTMSCEQPASNPGANTLHVIGRTHAAPRQYFHRRYANGAWTPWEPLDADIQGDHVVAAFWKQRLHVFWLTFSDSAAQEAPAASFSASVTRPATVQTREVRLAWADCIRGEWNTHLCAGEPMAFRLPPSADGTVLPPQRHVAIRLRVERDAEGKDAALLVRVHANDSRQAFRVISHNAPVSVEPDQGWDDEPLASALAGLSASINRHRVEGKELVTSFYRLDRQVVRENSNGATIQNPEADAGPGRLLNVGAGGMTVTLLDAPLRTGEPVWSQRLSPFFFADQSGSYYVEPLRKNRVEKVSDEWWDYDWKKYLENMPILPAQPIFPRVPDPRPPRPWDDGNPRWPGAIDPGQPRDWLFDPRTEVRYDGLVIGAQQRLSLLR